MCFVATASDPCIFTKGTNIIIFYVEDCIIMFKNKEEADALVSKLKTKGYKSTDEGTMEEYLGIMIAHNADGSYRMSQPHLIDRIIDSIQGMSDVRSAKSPACSSIILTKDLDGPPRKEKWKYRSVVEMLNFLVNYAHQEMSYVVHQCARFFNDQRHSHKQAAKKILRYLISTRRNQRGEDCKIQGIMYRPDKTRSIDTYIDASFARE